MRTSAILGNTAASFCAGMALTSSLGRWLLVLLAIPAYPLAGADVASPAGARGATAGAPPVVTKH